MLKKIAIALMLILPMGVAAQTLKFGHVTSNEIIMAMPEFTKAQTDLQALEKKYTDEIKRTNDEFNTKSTKSFNKLWRKILCHKISLKEDKKNCRI
jgi:outer membrane protein